MKTYETLLTGGDKGVPSAPLPNGLLVLAHAGSLVWNEWRAAFPTERDGGGIWMRAVKWQDPGSGQDIQFSNYGEIDFSGFIFGDGADFSNRQFSTQWLAKFDGAIFGDEAQFDNAHFAGGASFRKAEFGRGAAFRGVTFSKYPQTVGLPWVCFEEAQLRDEAILVLTFNWSVAPPSAEVNFSRARFGANTRILLNPGPPSGRLNFENCRFGSNANLGESDFGSFTSFRSAQFGDGASFKKSVIRDMSFDGAEFLGSVDFQGDSFSRVDFRGTRFNSVADFSNRKFTARARFGAARFRRAPLFHNADLHQDTEFDEESFPERADQSGEASRAYRTLKLAMSKHQATREEQFFFRMEMREEQGELWRAGSLQKRMRAMLYRLYSVFSGYGASVAKPTFFLVVTWSIAAGVYGAIAQQSSFLETGVIDWHETLRWITFSVANSVPLGGADEMSRELRGRLLESGKAAWLPLILITHKLITVLLAFLIGLGLRNMFKMK